MGPEASFLLPHAWREIERDDTYFAERRERGVSLHSLWLISLSLSAFSPEFLPWLERKRKPGLGKKFLGILGEKSLKEIAAWIQASKVPFEEVFRIKPKEASASLTTETTI